MSEKLKGKLLFSFEDEGRKEELGRSLRILLILLFPASFVPAFAVSFDPEMLFFVISGEILALFLIFSVIPKPGSIRVFQDRFAITWKSSFS